MAVSSPMAMPHGLTRFGSVRAASPARSETRFFWMYPRSRLPWAAAELNNNANAHASAATLIDLVLIASPSWLSQIAFPKCDPMRRSEHAADRYAGLDKMSRSCAGRDCTRHRLAAEPGRAPGSAERLLESPARRRVAVAPPRLPARERAAAEVHGV